MVSSLTHSSYNYSMNRKFRLFFSVSLLVLLGFIISHAIKIEDLKKIIWDFPKEQLLIFMVISLGISFLKAWRFLLLLHNAKIPINLWTTSKLYFASQTTTPLPGGEALRGVLIKHETDVPVIKSSGPIITQAFLEIGSALFLVLIGSFIVEDDFLVPVLISSVVLTVIAFILLNEKIFQMIFSRLPEKKSGTKLKKILFAFRTKLKLVQTGMLHNIKDPQHSLVKTFIVSIGIHLLGGLLVFAIAKSYDLNINFFSALFVYTAGVVIQGLSVIVPGGLGLTEGGMTGLLLLSNIELSKALAVVIIFRLVTLFYNVLIGLIFFILFYAKDVLFEIETAKN